MLLLKELKTLNKKALIRMNLVLMKVKYWFHNLMNLKNWSKNQKLLVHQKRKRFNQKNSMHKFLKRKRTSFNMKILRKKYPLIYRKPSFKWMTLRKMLKKQKTMTKAMKRKLEKISPFNSPRKETLLMLQMLLILLMKFKTMVFNKKVEKNSYNKKVKMEKMILKSKKHHMKDLLLVLMLLTMIKLRLLLLVLLKMSQLKMKLNIMKVF